MQHQHSLQVIGHRGAAGLVFENTLASVQKALDLGLSALEIDVWQTADGEIVVFHDAYLDRLTHATGLISEKTYAEIQKIPLTNGDRIPTLQAVLDLVKPLQVVLIVEVKAGNAFAKTTELLLAALPPSRFFIGSFYHQPVLELKQQFPALGTAIMLECVPANVETYLQSIDPALVVLAIETVNEAMITAVKAQNRKLIFYTVNTPAQFALAQREDADGIITNFPDLFLNR